MTTIKDILLGILDSDTEYHIGFELIDGERCFYSFYSDEWGDDDDRLINTFANSFFNINRFEIKKHIDIIDHSLDIRYAFGKYNIRLSYPLSLLMYSSNGQIIRDILQVYNSLSMQIVNEMGDLENDQRTISSADR